MSLTPSGNDEAVTLQELRRIRGKDLRPVPLPGEETEPVEDESEESS